MHIHTYTLHFEDPNFGNSKIIMSNKFSKHKIYTTNCDKYFNWSIRLLHQIHCHLTAHNTIRIHF